MTSARPQQRLESAYGVTFVYVSVRPTILISDDVLFDRDNLHTHTRLSLFQRCMQPCLFRAGEYLPPFFFTGNKCYYSSYSRVVLSNAVYVLPVLLIELVLGFESHVCGTFEFICKNTKYKESISKSAQQPTSCSSSVGGHKEFDASRRGKK